MMFNVRVGGVARWSATVVVEADDEAEAEEKARNADVDPLTSGYSSDPETTDDVEVIGIAD